VEADVTLPPGMSVEDYIGLVKTFMPDFHRVACAKSEAEFCSAVERTLRHCLGKLEDRRKLLVNDGEVQLSTDLADLLTCRGLPTKAEAHVNGHVDLLISHFEADRYRMLGECKIDGGPQGGPQRHCDGTNQLLDYCSGAEKRALSIDFCKMPNVQGRMKKTRQHFDKAGDCHAVEETRDHDLPWSFLGVHKHASGSTVEVVHIACNLHDADASDRTTDPT
jgi:hypothetical protein